MTEHEVLTPSGCPDCGLPVLIPTAGTGAPGDPLRVEEVAIYAAIARHVRALPEMHPTLLRRRWGLRFRWGLRRRLVRAARWARRRWSSAGPR